MFNKRKEVCNAKDTLIEQGVATPCSNEVVFGFEKKPTGKAPAGIHTDN